MKNHQRAAQVLAIITFVLLILFLLVIAFSSRNVLTSFRSEISSLSTNSKTLHSTERVIYYDQALTKSVKNYALTKNEKWLNRYQQVNVLYDSICNSLDFNLMNNFHHSFFNKDDHVKLELTRLEEEAIKAIKKGDQERAMSLLFSKQYDELKSIRLSRIDALLRDSKDGLIHIEEGFESIKSRTEKLSNLTVIIFALIIILFTSLIFVVFRLIQHVFEVKRKLEQKNAEYESVNEELADNKNNLQNIFDSIHDMIFIASGTSVIEEVNRTVLSKLCVERSSLIGKSLQSVFPVFAQDLIIQNLTEGVGKVHVTEDLIVNQNIRIPVDLVVQKIIRFGEEIILCSARDLSEKVEIERTKQELEHKELLLKEIHHRVKNNMQIISSLLSLQANHSQIEVVKEKLLTSQNRIKAMALVHEQLYQSNELSLINTSSYFFDLLNFLETSIINSAIKVITHIDTFEINLDQAVPCGLILSELISNSVKYAFEDEQEGSVLIRLSTQGEYVCFHFSDNGRGVTSLDVLDKPNSLGIRLVRTLTKQLGGDLLIYNQETGGLAFDIKFPLNL